MVASAPQTTCATNNVPLGPVSTVEELESGSVVVEFELEDPDKSAERERVISPEARCCWSVADVEDDLGLVVPYAQIKFVLDKVDVESDVEGSEKVILVDVVLEND